MSDDDDDHHSIASSSSDDIDTMMEKARVEAESKWNGSAAADIARSAVDCSVD